MRLLSALGFTVVTTLASLRGADAEKVIGWRGDGSGRYPNANPPTTWSRSEKGEKKNIAWEVKLPCYSWATPIIVGDKVLTRSEPYDLICLSKKDGKLLWIRSVPPFVAVSDEEKKAKPEYAEVETLCTKLQAINDEFVAKGWSKEIYKRKYDVQKQINDLTAKIDPKYKLPRDMYVESWAGYTGSTPCSDGQFIYLTSGVGITACYDLDGNRKWARYESVEKSWGEHGNACSPTLIGDKLLAPTMALHAFDKKTGADLMTFICKGQGNDGYGIQPFQAGGAGYVVAFGNILKLSDGQSVFHGDHINMFTLHDDYVYFSNGGAFTIKCEAKPDGTLNARPVIQEEYNKISYPIDDPAKKWEPMFNFYTASPLYHDGLLYSLSNWGKLVVVDTSKIKQQDAIVYSQKVPFDFKNPQHRKSYGMGIGASPALAGKYIYMIDSAGCTIVIEPGREYKQVAKNNIDEIVPEGWEPTHWVGPHHEQTEASLAFDENRIYIRGEQYLYCIGEK